MVTISADIEVYNAFGELIALLNLGDRVEVVSGVFWEEINDQPGVSGWHWSAILPNGAGRGLIWEGRFRECQP